MVRAAMPGVDRQWAILLSVGSGLVLGALTALGQQYLSDDWRSVANCAGSWTLVAFVAAGASRGRATSICLGAITLVALLIGYAMASEARGFTVSVRLMVFWGTAALTVGPVVGLAAASLRRADDRLAVMGAGVMSGVLIGEGVYGLTIVDATTAPHWWVVELVVGAILVVGVTAYRRPTLVTHFVGLGTTAVVAAMFWFVYRVNLLSLV